MMQRQPRQLPVSCQLCRSMKLKCSREQPCSNCVSRGVACERPTPSSKPTAVSKVRRQRRRTPPADSDNASILMRLQRLESLVLGAQSPPAQSFIQLETPDRSIGVTPPLISEEEGETRWLQEAGTRGVSLLSGLSDGVAFQVLSIQTVLAESARDSPSRTDNPAQNVWLPPKIEALWLLEKYAEHVAYMHHVVHIPSLRTLIENLYQQLHLGSSIDSSHVALVLSMLASTAYVLDSSDGSDEIFSSVPNAIKCAFKWSKAALDVLQHSQRTTSGSFEDIQATIILSFVLFNFEGLSTRFRSLCGHALFIAKDISLHRIDAEVKDSRTPRDSLVQIEVKRRVWWHLVSTDWMLALSGGPQEGTYTIHPKQMKVNYPRNIDDTAIEHLDHEYSAPLSQPTTMTYSIMRIRLSEICRSVVDTLSPQSSDWGRVNYQDIISLDGQFERFHQDLPFFFRLDEASLQQSPEIDQIDRRYPQIAIQRYIICNSFHSQRFKLNQPFLTRISLDPRYQYSREVCLRSARAVIKIKRLLGHGTKPFAAMHTRLATFLHTFFLATAVLVMDLCFNKSQNQDTKERRAEVMDACRMMQDAERSSPMASKYLKPLTDTLHKHKILLPAFTAPGDASTGPYPSIDPIPPTVPAIYYDPVGGADNTDLPSRGFANTVDADSGYANTGSISDMWQTFIDMDQSPTPSNWDVLFSALDAGFPLQ